jgi:hypothetical protein
VLRKGTVARLALAVASAVVVLLALEMTLRTWPTLLGLSFANGALSRYTTRPGGIYYFDRSLWMNFMIPNHSATMWAAGHTWHHRTDALGFRNEPLHVPADVILLGDSVVYGHGVEFEHTLGPLLERRTGLRVANLGRQGDCAFQEAYLITAYLPVFRPRFVVHVFSPNDIHDLYGLVGEAKMRAFVATPVEQIAFPPRLDPASLVAARERRLARRPLGTRLEEDLYLMKAFRWVQHVSAQWRAARAAARGGGNGAEATDVSTDPTSLGWRYTEHALVYMNHVAERGGARLLTTAVAERPQRDILRDVAGRAGIPFIDSTTLFVPSSFLPNDGHLSPAGARLMADLIAGELDRRR